MVSWCWGCSGKIVAYFLSRTSWRRKLWKIQICQNWHRPHHKKCWMNIPWSESHKISLLAQAPTLLFKFHWEPQSLIPCAMSRGLSLQSTQIQAGRRTAFGVCEINVGNNFDEINVSNTSALKRSCLSFAVGVGTFRARTRSRGRILYIYLRYWGIRDQLNDLISCENVWGNVKYSHRVPLLAEECSVLLREAPT